MATRIKLNVNKKLMQECLMFINSFNFFSSFELNFIAKIELKLRYRLFFLLLLFNHITLFANWVSVNDGFVINQDTTIVPDTLANESLPDSVQNKKSIDDPVFTNAEDSIVYSLDGKIAYLYGNAVVTYQDLELKANYIEFDMETKQVYASGLADSTGKVIGKPQFKEGSKTFKMDKIYYNFDTRRAKIIGVVTEEAGGFMHSAITKKMENDVVNLKAGKYTSCDLDHPHFYLAVTKGKIIPNNKIVAGPAYLVIEDVPFPLFIPFGFFPNTKKRSAGLLIPEYGEEKNRGLFLRGGGFYFGMGDYMDEKITFDIYSRGSWGIRSQTNYKLRYKFSGSLNIETSAIINSEKGLPDYSKTSSYWIRWSHRQDPKASPNSTFQANVNFGSSNYNKYNARNINTALSNTFNSSISYSKNWAGTPFSLTASLNHSQNTINETVNLNFPRVAFNMSRIYPFKRKNAVGSPKWYEKVGLSLNTSFDNRVQVLEENLFKPSVLDSMQNGMKHSIPVSTSFNILKFITVSPGVNYNEFWYLQTIEKHWNADSNRVEVDTVRSFKRGYEYNGSVSMSTKVYGMFQFSKNSKVQAIRHVLTPSVSLGYRPDFSDPKYGFYKTVQIDSTGNTTNYSIFENGIYGGPGGGKSGVVSFSLSNLLEMKVKSDKDTVNQTKKIKIIDGLSANTSYNLLADSLNWSDIAVSGRTSLFDGKVNINFSGGFSLYALDANGKKYNKFELNNSGKLARFTRGNVGIDFSLNSKKEGQNSSSGRGGLRGAPGSEIPLGTAPDGSNFGESLGTQYGMDYVDFSVPWNVRFSYNLSYSKPALQSSLVQTLSFSGSVNLTPKWKIGFSSGYDFKNRKLTTTSLNFYRDLHCWEMRLTVIPIGYYKSFSFTINVKSSLLHDLKFTKRDHYLDNQ
jgi:lipopolysaccharide assembly outer membrane protein LptD (OstA)